MGGPVTRFTFVPLTRIVIITAACVIALSDTARAQSAAQGVATEDGWRFALYPIFAWVPIDIGIDVDVPPGNGDGGEAGQILESRFDGAFFGGLTAYTENWRIEGYGIWAAFGGDRLERPFLTVDVDLIYGDARVGRRVAPDLFLTGGVRRVALDYDITLGDLPNFSRKPGVWDPLIGIGWHRIGPTIEWHASFEGGGFGVGADVDLGASVRVDWKPLRHFGLAAGYNFLYLKVTDSIAGRTVVIEPTIHGPSLGLGIYF
jgi:hypothetical protein